MLWCIFLTQIVQPSVGRELFAAGFASCWAQMNESSQEQLVRSLKTAFSSQNIPPEILATLLNLVICLDSDPTFVWRIVSYIQSLPFECRQSLWNMMRSLFQLILGYLVLLLRRWILLLLFDRFVKNFNLMIFFFCWTFNSHQCRAFAKALHYKEMEFEAVCTKKMGANPVTVVESLIHINNQLHQHEVDSCVLH